MPFRLTKLGTGNDSGTQDRNTRGNKGGNSEREKGTPISLGNFHMLKPPTPGEQPSQ